MIPYNEPLAFQSVSDISARSSKNARIESQNRFNAFLDQASKARNKLKEGLVLEDYRSNPVTCISLHSAEKIGYSLSSVSALSAYERNLQDSDVATTFALKTQDAKESVSDPSENPKESSRHELEDLVARAARNYDLSPELISAVIKVESGFRSDAVSPAGAMGLMQLMPGTAQELGVANAFDPAQNIDGGAKYLRQMLDLFDQDLEKALMAYNAGPGTVQRYEGKVPYFETLRYVEKVMACASDKQIA